MNDSYIIVEETTAPMLAQKVREFIEKGYDLAGGVAVDHKGKYLQGVFLPENKRKVKSSLYSALV